MSWANLSAVSLVSRGIVAVINHTAPVAIGWTGQLN